MRVKKDYYSDETYYKPEVVQRIAEVCNAIIRKPYNDFEKSVAHQLKCLVIKRYRRNDNRKFIPLCKEWEADPQVAFEWLLAFKRERPRRIDLVAGAKCYSPENIRGEFAKLEPNKD